MPPIPNAIPINNVVNKSPPFSFNMVVTGGGSWNCLNSITSLPGGMSSVSANAVKDNVASVAIQSKIVKKTFWDFFI